MSLYPLLKNEAGNHAWNNMHHRASLYPDNPTTKEKERMKAFLYESMKGVADLCSDCKKHIKEYLLKNPIQPHLESKEKLSLYLCNFHNSVNRHTGKEEKDCLSILRPKSEAECKDCKHEIKIRKDTTDLKATFEFFKEASTKVFYTLCDKYKIPYPTIKFHECPGNPLNSCTSMWVDSQTKDIVEKPIVYLHPNMFGLRSIVHEFIHYMRQMKKDDEGGMDEMQIEKDAQYLINHEFPFDELEEKDKRPPVIAATQAQQVIRQDYTSRLRNFPNAARVYDKYLVNIKRRDPPQNYGQEQGDWVFDMMSGITKGRDEGIEEEIHTTTPHQEKYHNVFSFLDGIYSPFGSLFGMSASDINRQNTPLIVANATTTLIKSYLSPIGSLLTTAGLGLGILGALIFSKNGLSYGDKILMNNFGSQFLFSNMDYLRPEAKEDIIEGASLLGNVVAAQKWELIPQVILGETLQALAGVGEATAASTINPQSATRSVQRAAGGGASSGSLAGGKGNIGSNTIASSAFDKRQQMADLRQIQKEIIAQQQGSGRPSGPEQTRAVITGAGKGGNVGDLRRKAAIGGVGGSGVNSMPMYDPNTVIIPSEEDETMYESSFGMHVADGSGGRSTMPDDDYPDTRNTVRDIFEQDPGYDNFNDVYYEDSEYYG